MWLRFFDHYVVRSLVFASIYAASFIVTFWITERLHFSFFLAGLVGTTALLFYLLSKFWLVDRYPRFRTLLERIPGVSFPIPVPEQLLNNPSWVKQPLKQEKYKTENEADISTDVNDLPVINQQEAAQEPEPFTLGTLVFEPPEPINKPTDFPESRRAKGDFYGETLGDSNVAKVSVEGAFQRSKKQTKGPSLSPMLARFKYICRILKQTNMEVAIWTEAELMTLAHNRLTENAKDHDMVAVLLPQYVVTLEKQRTLDFEHHATVLNRILGATGKRLDVHFINSSKDQQTGTCVVNFEYKGQPITWRFVEDGNWLSDAFLSSALRWVAKRANGNFIQLSVSDAEQSSFVFVSDKLVDQLLLTSRVY